MMPAPCVLSCSVVLTCSMRSLPDSSLEMEVMIEKKKKKKENGQKEQVSRNAWAIVVILSF